MDVPVKTIKLGGGGLSGRPPWTSLPFSWDCGGRHRLGAYGDLGPASSGRGDAAGLKSPLSLASAAEDGRFVMSPLGCPGDRRSPNLTVTDTVLAALQSDRGDVFSRQTGVRDASAVLGPEQVGPPFVRQSFLFFA
jgi:hypothetical protein